MTQKESCEREISRFFKKYYMFCDSSDSDDLKDLLSVLSSSFEKLENFTKVKLKNNKRLDALKALRNFATHESELLNESKAIGLQSTAIVHAEVKFLCLIPISAVEYILTNLRSNSKKECIKKNIVFYKKFVDIYPLIFNATIDLYFLAEQYLLEIKGEGFSSISKSIKFEKENGYSHYIDGKIIMLDGSDVNHFLDTAIISIGKKNFEQSSLPADEDGLYSVTSLYSISPVEQANLMKAKDKKHILDQLLSTKAIEIKTNDLAYSVAYMNRELTPIETVIAHQYAESLNKHN